MRLIATSILFAAIALAQSGDEKGAVAAAQRLFDGMTAHDAAMIRSVLLPEARLYAVREERTTNMTGEAFAEQLGKATGNLVEKFTGTPQVMIRGRMAVVWGEYAFLRDGKLNHCGVDSFTLFHTDGGWKVASVAYTTETTGCKEP